MASRFGRTVTARAILVTCVAAVVSVLVTALVAFPIALRAANQDARTALDKEASLVAALLGPRLASPRTRDDEAILRRLATMQIDVYVIRGGEPDRAGLPRRVVDLVAAGRPVDAHQALVGGEPRLVAGRPLPNRAGVVLTQDPDTGVFRGLTRRLGLALLAGLAAGLGAGALLARRLVGPIRHAAVAARRLSAGERTVRLAMAAPAEVEDLTRALNDLATALATSEGRQRDFLLSISHELRTPLTTIRGYAEALADGVIGPDGAARAGQTMLGEAERLDRLVADLLVLARLEAADFPVEFLPVDLTDLVRTTADAWAARCAGVGVVLRTELPDGPVPVQTDPGRLRQVVDGLLENALRVVPPGAPIVLGVRPGPESAVAEVRDGGPGFTDDDLAVAFERGALHQRYQGVRTVGSGLGLALAARLVRRLGGTIEAGHASEGGARFTVVLPYIFRTSH
jgi:signal transduction histidine kinase